jgi:hypothetical protein
MMTTHYASEITELHLFFQDYFNGIIPFEAVSHFDQTLGAGLALSSFSLIPLTEETGL